MVGRLKAIQAKMPIGIRIDAKYGEELYRIRCMSCHGDKGQGGVSLDLSNPVVQKKAVP